MIMIAIVNFMITVIIIIIIVIVVINVICIVDILNSASVKIFCNYVSITADICDNDMI